jgi:hypothetical protein
MRAFCGLLAVAVTLLAAGGCGGGSSSDSGEISVQTGSLTKAKFVSKANEICEERKQQFERKLEALEANLPAQVSKSQQAQAAKLIASLINPTYKKLIDQISSLGAPSGDEEQVGSFLSAVQQSLDELRQQPTKAFEGLTPFERASKLARAYGLSTCADSLS